MPRFTTLSLISAMVMTGSATADIVNLGGTAPASDVIDSQLAANSFTRTFDISFNTNTRGNFFSTGDNALAGGTQFDIDSIAVRKNANQTFGAGSTLTLYVWEGSIADWDTGDGSATHAESEIFDNTTVTQLYSEVFDLEGTFSNNDWLSLELASDLLLDENSDFGFLLVYSKGAGSDPDFLEIDETTASAAGHEGQARTTGTDNSQNGRQLVHAIVGTPVPEPGSLALLGLGGLLIARRRRV